MNILKYKDIHRCTPSEVYQYKIGFMLDRKSVFLPQVVYSFLPNLRIKQFVASFGYFDNKYNNLLELLKRLNEFPINQIEFVQTNHIINEKIIIIGLFYEKVYCYTNVPFVTIDELIRIIRYNHQLPVVQIPPSGEYDFSYSLDGGINNGVFQFLHVKTAFNVLAFVMGKEYVLKDQFDCIRNAIMRNNVKTILYENYDEDIKNWITNRQEKDAHFVIIKNISNTVVAFVSFYGEMVYCFKMAESIEEHINFAFICDWKNKKESIVYDL